MTARAPRHRPPRFGVTFEPPQCKRESAAKRGYDRKWRAKRARFLRFHPKCACGARASEVDHIVAKRKGGGDDWSNLRAMCKPCHSRKTAAVDGSFGRKNRSTDRSEDRVGSQRFFSTKTMFGQEVIDDGTQ